MLLLVDYTVKHLCHQWVKGQRNIAPEKLGPWLRSRLHWSEGKSLFGGLPRLATHLRWPHSHGINNGRHTPHSKTTSSRSKTTVVTANGYTTAKQRPKSPSFWLGKLRPTTKHALKPLCHAIAPSTYNQIPPKRPATATSFQAR